MALACLYAPKEGKQGFLRNMESMGHTDLSAGGTPIQVIVAGYGESYSSAHKAGGGEIPGGSGMNTRCRYEYQGKVI